MEVPDRKWRKEVKIKNKILNLMLPVSGCLSYELFSTNIMNITEARKLLGDAHPIAAEILWFNAHMGFGVHLYNQEIFQQASICSKLVYSAFITAMFNFGSVLMWGTAKTLFHKCHYAFRTVFGLGSGLVLLYTGQHLIAFLNYQVRTSGACSPNNNRQ